ncbi:unnamed protein product [Microthlaspi erraticum]|uniref:F-box domain-containing protein n=1 Tax=Microthlaspi erraticum TaxID=1685480 RepID=A0A6D2HB79_9BRAS|nr:unnamed protein product [Microthlaspi erraticum]
MERTSLTQDSIEEIFSRFPTKSLARLQSLSKQWNAIFKSENFSKKHSANAPKEPLIMMLMDSRVCLVKVNLQGFHDGVAPSSKVAYQFNLTNPSSDSSSSQVIIRNIIHCDGLLLCTTNDNRLAVWNPCSGETKWIKPKKPYMETDFYALGYDNESPCKKYKILRMVRQDPNLPIDEYQIYDFISDSWKVLEDVTTNWDLLPNCRGISMKGDTYWVAFDTSPKGWHFLLSFDFSRERFRSMSLPHRFPYSNGTLSVVGEEKLFLLGNDRTELDLWVTSSPRSVMSWRKFLAGMDCFPFHRKVGFLVDEQNKVVVCCDDDVFTELDIVGESKHREVDYDDGHSEARTYCSHLQSYVPSLVQIQ